MQAGSEFSHCDTGRLLCASVQFGVKRLQRGHNQSCFQARVVALSIVGWVAFSHTPACMLCLLSGLCETLNQEANKKPSVCMLAS